MGESFLFSLPPEIFFGIESGKKTGEKVRKLGSKGLVVTGKKAVKNYGILDELTLSLRQAGLSWSLFDQVEAEPSLETVNRGVQAAKDAACDWVLSLGGGSVLDCGKAIAGLVGNDERVEPYFRGEKTLSRAGVPWIALPTTAGTGSEMTRNAVLTDYKNNIKKSFRSPYLIARLVVIDPTYTRFLSPYLTATSGVDSLVQAIEAYISPRTNPISQILSLEAIRTIWQELPLVVKKGDDLSRRESMAKGSMLSAMAFANASSSPAHGLAHIVGPLFSVTHGEACGIFLPWIIRWNSPLLAEEYAQIARAVGIKGEVGSELAEKLAAAFEDLLEKVGLATRLRQLGIKQDQLAGIIQPEKIGRSIRENPRPLEEEDLYSILNQAW
ncbi:MAG: hypothetical protein PWP04_230 [Candidatus Atribacteria bacterium]|nr:hypothetical protein [Candidatus Atribacteria bacterium]